MSLPTGSKAISNINTSTYNYLLGESTVATNWNSAKSSFIGRGKPLSNLTKETVTLEDIRLVTRELPEGQNGFIFSNNAIYSGDNVGSDFMFTTNPSTEYEMWITFIDEGAGYKNSLGYFFYVHNGSNYVILDNSDMNTDSSQGYYRPTIIFPNASSIAGGNLRSDGVLLPGHKRKLKGNLSNNKFQNVNVGFFLVPNGWDNRDVSQSIGVRYDNKAILHTYAPFNPNYVANALGASNYGYQTILFNYNAGQNYVIGFEDIQRPGGDGDFNDLIIRVETSPNINFTNTPTVTVPNLINNCLQKTKQGLLLVAPVSSFPNFGNSNYTYTMRRTIRFDTAFNRDRCLEIYSNNYLTFKHLPTVQTSGEKDLVIEYSFNNTHLTSNIVDNHLQLYLLMTDDNRDDETIVDPENPDENERTKFDKLVLLQRLENDNVLHEDYQLDQVDSSQTRSTVKTETNTVPYNTIGSSQIWGDPHIQKINGEIVTLSDATGWFTYFESSGLKIETEFDFYKDHPVPVYRDATFIKTVRLSDHKSGHTITIDAFDPKLSYNTASADGLVFQEADLAKPGLRAKMLQLLNFDESVSFKVFNWRNRCNIWVIYYQGRPDFFNEVFIENHDLVNLLTPDAKGLLL